MPVTYFKETWESRQLRYGVNGGGETLVYIALGSTDQVEVYAHAVANTDIVYDGFIRSDIKIDPLGGAAFAVTVEYGTAGQGGGSTPVGVTPEPPTAPGGSGGSGTPGADEEPLGPGYQIDISAQTKHFTQSYGTRYLRRAGDALNVPGSAPDNKRAIGVHEGKVEGCDAFESYFEWSRQVSLESVDRAYINKLRNLVGKKNNATYYTADAGEVLFLGASGGQTEGTKWQLTFKFGERKNIVNQIVVPDPTDPLNPAAANALVIPAAAGWDHVWYGYEKQVVNNQVAPVPIYAYVDTVVEDGDFSLLGIGY